MYVHIVMMQFRADAGADFIGRVEAYARRIQAECAGVRMYALRTNEASRSDGYTHAVVSGFDDAAAHDAYQVSPAHVEMKAFMGPFIERLVVFDGSADLLGVRA